MNLELLSGSSYDTHSATTTQLTEDRKSSSMSSHRLSDAWFGFTLHSHMNCLLANNAGRGGVAGLTLLASA